MVLTFHLCEIPQSGDSVEISVADDQWLDTLRIMSGFRTLNELVSQANIDTSRNPVIIAMENGQRRFLTMNETSVFRNLFSVENARPNVRIFDKFASINY